MQTTQAHPQQSEPANLTDRSSSNKSMAGIRSETMQAIVHRSYGNADVLKHETLDLPEIGENDVLIEVHSAAIDRGTWYLMSGTPYMIRLFGFGFSKPKHIVPGFDVAGRVVAVGDAVTRFSQGDEVYGIARGSLAEYAAATEDKLVLKPDNVNFDVAAATISGITALEALTDIGKLQAGQHVLIIGASGGVGSYAVQLAKALGAEVSGVGSAAKADLIRSLGADHAIDYRTNYLDNSAHQYDLIIDIGGRNSVSKLRSVLHREGTLVFVGGEGGNKLTGGIGRQIKGVLMSPFIKQSLKMFVSLEKPSIINRLNEFIKSGAVVPSIGGRFSLQEAPTAMRELEAGKIAGKSIITVRP